jgi:hypothetical protein
MKFWMPKKYKSYNCLSKCTVFFIVFHKHPTLMCSYDIDHYAFIAESRESECKLAMPD